MAIVSYGTITITDTNDIERIYTVYAKSTTNTTAPSAAASSWTESISTAPGSGDYIWQRTVVKKSGTGELTYSNPVCVTGPEGNVGKGVKSVITQYYLSTSSSSVTGGSWNTTPQTYPASGTKYYWTKTITTYTDNTTYESTAVYNVALTNSVKDARDANTTANSANTKADNAVSTANSANTTATNAYNIATGINQHFWTIATDYAEGLPAGSYITDTAIDTFKSQKTGGNLLTRSDGIWIRNGVKTLTSLTGSALTFYNPSTNTAQLVIGANGTLQSGNYSRGSDSKFSSNGTKIDLINGDIITKYFRLSQGLESLNAGAYIHGTIEALDGSIGSDTTNYWEIGNGIDYNLNSTAKIIGHGSSYIQLGDSSTWRLATNRIHTGWYTSSDSLLHFPSISSKYWDFGIHSPSSATDKFLYIRSSKANTSASNVLQNLLYDIDDSYATSQWDYKFYIDGEGNLYAKNLYFFDENGNPVQVGGADGAYLPKTGGTITGNLEVNGTLTKGSKNVAYLTATPTNGQILITDGTAGGIKTSGYTIATSVPSGALFTDKNVQTTKANTTKIYLVGTQTNGTNTGTLNFDEYVYVDTTAGALHATTYNGYTLAAASAKGVDTSMTSTSTSTNLPTTKAVADLIATYLPLTGGTVSGAVDINDELYADSATFGNLIVNGAGRFTNGIYGDLTGNVTGSITGNAATADKVNHNLVIKLASGTTEGTNMFTFNGSAAKTVDITKSALGLGNVENKSSATIRSELTSANVTTALGFTPYNSTNPNGYTSNIGTITGVTAGTGLSGGGTSGAVTLNHSNSVTAQTTQGIYPIKIDAQGHISAYGSAPTTLSGYGITDAKIANGVITLGSNTITPLTSQWTANLYVGKTATDKANAAATNGNVYLNLVENSTVRNAHKITGSGTTTVTSDADGNITISSADSKTGTVTSITLTQGTGITIGSSGTAITTSGSRTISLADNYGDTKNPYASKTARYVLAAPADAAGVPTFRALTGADVGLGNVLNAAQVTGIGQGADGKIRVYKGDSNYEDVAVEIVATESSSVASAQKLTSYGGSTKQPVYFPNSGTNAGKPVAIGYTIETSVPSGAVFTDTTYTFANGTNGFTVTPLNGTAQTVTVTPSIANNITGSGTSGYLAKFNGANTITNGPALGTDTTKFLNNKGEWSTPSGAVTGVKGNSESTYRTGQVNITKANIGLGNVDNTADANKNVLTATKFSSSRTIALTGDVTGSASSDGTNGWSITTEVGDDSHNHTEDTIVPKMTKTYTGVIATANTDAAAHMYNVKIVPDTYGEQWFIKYRVKATIAGVSEANGSGMQESIVYISGMRNTYAAYRIWNNVINTSYRPYYYHTARFASEVALSEGHKLGISFRYAYHPATAENSREVTFEIMDYGGCTVSFLDSFITFTDFPSTNYSSLVTFDATTQGNTMSGDRNDVNYNNREYYSSRTAHSFIGRYMLVLSRSDGTIIPTVSVDNNITTSKTYNTTDEFDPFGDIYYFWSSGTIAANANVGNNTLYRQVMMDLRYAFNIGGYNTTSLITARKPFYLVATPQSDGMAKIHSSGFSQTLPTSDDGLIYIYLGMIYEDTYPYRLNLALHHPVYWYKNGAIRSYISDALTVNGHTVQSDVPSNAKFTDTWNALSTSQAGYVTKAPNDTGKFLRGDATWAVVTKANVGLGNVENTALSTWTGTNKITTVGTITTGTWNGTTIDVSHGGTGKTNGRDAANYFLNSLDTGSSTPADNDYYISQYVNGGTTTTTYHRRPMSALWSYISGKISSSNTYVTLTTAQTLTAAATKTYLGLQLYGSQGIGFGTTGTNDAVTQKANVKYDDSLQAIVFSFS